MTTLTEQRLRELESRLQVAQRTANYWAERRRGQVSNCPSDSEHQLEADRACRALEYQIRELKKCISNSTP